MTASRPVSQFFRSESVADRPGAVPPAGAAGSAGAVAGLVLAGLVLAGLVLAGLVLAGLASAGLALDGAALSGGLAAFRSGGAGTRVRSEKSFVPECGGGGGDCGSRAGLRRPPASPRSARGGRRVPPRQGAR